MAKKYPVYPKINEGALLAGVRNAWDEHIQYLAPLRQDPGVKDIEAFLQAVWKAFFDAGDSRFDLLLVTPARKVFPEEFVVFKFKDRAFRIRVQEVPYVPI